MEQKKTQLLISIVILLNVLVSVKSQFVKVDPYKEMSKDLNKLMDRLKELERHKSDDTALNEMNGIKKELLEINQKIDAAHETIITITKQEIANLLKLINEVSLRLSKVDDDIIKQKKLKAYIKDGSINSARVIFDSINDNQHLIGEMLNPYFESSSDQAYKFIEELTDCNRKMIGLVSLFDRLRLKSEIYRLTNYLFLSVIKNKLYLKCDLNHMASLVKLIKDSEYELRIPYVYKLEIGKQLSLIQLKLLKLKQT